MNRSFHRGQNSQQRAKDFKMLCCACLATLSVLAFLFSQFTVSSQQADQRERMIDDKYSYADCPIKIIGVETIKHKFSLGKSFSDSDDWMKGLTIRIKNVSDKVVTHVGITITFDRPADQPDQARAAWDIWYGVSPFYFKPNESIPPPLVRLIRPGETELIFLSDTDYEAMTDFLKDLKFPSSIERIHISVYTIGFTDGTAWGGQLYKRDPLSPHGWRPANKPKGGARNRTAFSFSFASTSYSQSAWGRMEDGTKPHKDPGINAAGIVLSSESMR